MVYQKTTWEKDMVISSDALNNLEDGVSRTSLGNDTINNHLSQIGAEPETFTNLAALQSTYPNGKTGLFVTADNGHEYVWVNGTWTDAGVYQPTQLAKNSVLPEHLSTTTVQNNKSGIVTDAKTTGSSFYAINEPILSAGIVNVRLKAVAGDMYLYLVKKDGLTFTVKDKVKITATDGWQSINTNFEAVGDGSEYIGVYGSIWFSHVGGNGFFEAAMANPQATNFTTIQPPAGVGFNFAIYSTIESKKVVELLNGIDNSLNQKSNVPYSDDGIKDFSKYSEISARKTYISNKILSFGKLVVHLSSPVAQNASIYVFNKNGLNFTVKTVNKVSLSVGENVIDMDYSSAGDGSEYIGVYGQLYFSRSGGNGFFESNTGDNKEYGLYETILVKDSTTGTTANWDFAIYAEYIRSGLTSEVFRAKNESSDLDILVNQIINKPTPKESVVQLTDFNMPRYHEIQDKTGFIGRWFDTTIGGVPVKATINEGSELYFKVKNTTTINVNFVLNSVKATPFFAYSIDGSPMTRQLITTPLLTTVTTDEHIVRVVVDGLTESEDKWLGEKGVAFKDVTVDEGGVVTGIVPKNRQILFHGDSITEGVRVLNMNADSTGNSATGAFPYIASSNLNSISYRVGFGATGVTKPGSGGVPELIKVIDNMTNARQAPYIEPDIVVMNMGTNDRAETSAVFTTKLNSVLDRLSIKYSGTPIFVMVPFIQAFKTEIENAVSTRSNMYIVETSDWNITTTDGLHPDISGGIVAGKKLADAIVSVLGKDFFI